MTPLITNVYIDGFNLYYGALKSTNYKWLDLRALASVLFPKDDIQRIAYFTARVNPRPNDPSQPQRQQAYLRALGTLPNLDIFFGHFARTANQTAGGSAQTTRI